MQMIVRPLYIDIERMGPTDPSPVHIDDFKKVTGHRCGLRGVVFGEIDRQLTRMSTPPCGHRLAHHGIGEEQHRIGRLEQARVQRFLNKLRLEVFRDLVANAQFVELVLMSCQHQRRTAHAHALRIGAHPVRGVAGGHEELGGGRKRRRGGRG
jgi:hypothetical protein